jgi:GT2 family glycosyltransferase
MGRADSPSRPLISVVVPVYNGAGFLVACLEALFASDYGPFEVIVVDDRSTDASMDIARRFPCTLIESAANLGPAAARNLGAATARGDVLFFLDADTLVRSGTLEAIALTFANDPTLATLFGCYSASPAPRDFFSLYKNLRHHYTHQHSRAEASTFCGGFGAIRRSAFDRLGGFDPDRRFLEDIEMGYRMSREGMRVRLCKELEFTHCKRYTFLSLLQSDLFGRAIPWTRLMLEKGIVRNDLNTKWHNVLSVPAAYLLLAAPFLPAPVYLAAALLALFLALNARFLALAAREGGLGFAAGACAMCWFGYIYSALGAVLGSAAYLRGRVMVAAPSARDLTES